MEGYAKEEARAEASRCLATLECLYCNVCETLCPDQCITRDPQTGGILIDLVHCKGCGLCAHYCPKGAIRMELEPTD
jgi:Pyruvate/2-oxoacid:ferredoxin oxidoreductase delta subunit